MKKEGAVIAQAHTVVDPWAVMVPVLHTLVTNVAVMRTRCRQDFAPWANIVWMEVGQ